MSRFYTWKGGPCPVTADSLVRPQIRVVSRSWAASREPSAAKGWRWTHRNDCGDIIAFEHVSGERA